MIDVVNKTRLFKGMKDNPFLAPRGVFLIKDKLFVADTAQNRLFIWNNLPTLEYEEPSVILGQSKKKDTGRNAQGAASEASLFYPSGLWSDGERLIIADAWNHRVLLWNKIPEKDNQKADVVIGQPDFLNNEPNVKGVSFSPTSRSLNWPYGVFSNGDQLWIADTGNRRVLYYKDIPTQNYQASDKVIGQVNFSEKVYDNHHAIWPYSVKISPKGEMVITDTQYYRVLLWHHWETATFQKADVIIGQDSFESNGQNQFRFFPKENTLSWCYDSCFYKDGLWVADTGNSRILWFDKIPKNNNASAVALIGQSDFSSGSENKNTIWNTEGSMYWPFQICIEKNIMVIADTGNHRIIINHLKI